MSPYALSDFNGYETNIIQRQDAFLNKKMMKLNLAKINQDKKEMEGVTFQPKLVAKFKKSNERMKEKSVERTKEMKRTSYDLTKEAEVFQRLVQNGSKFLQKK